MNHAGCVDSPNEFASCLTYFNDLRTPPSRYFRCQNSEFGDFRLIEVLAEHVFPARWMTGKLYSQRSEKVGMK